MGQLVFQATLGGQVNLVGPNTASTFNINVPAVAGNMVTTGDTGTVTSTMLASSLSLTTPNINVATGTSLKVSSGFYSTSSSSFTFTDGIVMDYTSTLGRISVGTSDGIAFYNGGVATTELMRLDSSGNLGIGTNSPSAKLAVVSGSSPNIATLQIGYSGSNNYYDANAHIFRNGSQTEGMRIDSSGNLLVGATADWTGGYSVVYGVASSTTRNRAISAYNSTTNGSALLARVDNTAASIASFYYGASTAVGSITTNGSTTTYGTSSDYRLKEDIAPMTEALRKVAALKPVTYKWKETQIQDEGFIAHELAEVCPNAVSGQKDATDENGNPVYQNIDTSFLVATLTAAIQEQQALIQQLQADVAALKA